MTQPTPSDDILLAQNPLETLVERLFNQLSRAVDNPFQSGLDALLRRRMARERDLLVQNGRWQQMSDTDQAPWLDEGRWGELPEWGTIRSKLFADALTAATRSSDNDVRQRFWQ